MYEANQIKKTFISYLVDYKRSKTVYNKKNNNKEMKNKGNRSSIFISFFTILYHLINVFVFIIIIKILL